MKNFLFIFSILLIACRALGQTLNFPDSNAIWSVYDQKYFVDGDSLFNATLYNKYYTTNDSVVASGAFYALLREDTTTGKVFSISAGQTQEQLLYDFSLQVGDTVSVYPISFPYYTGAVKVQVDAVDSLLLGNTYHKRLKITGYDQNTGYDEYWIEGIGSTMGIFNSGITGVVVFDIYYPTLLCFERDGNLLYDNPDFADCYEDYPTGLTELEFIQNINVFPNPFSQTVTVEAGEIINSIKIIDLEGKIIKHALIESQKKQLDMTGINQGVYFVIIESAKHKALKQIVKYK